MAIITSATAEPTRRAPADYFTGTVWQEPIVTAPEPARLRATRVSFEPGARTHWHTHAIGQVLVVTHGAGFVRTREGDGGRLAAGDVVHIAAGEEHWHGAAPDSYLLHVAISLGAATVVGGRWRQLPGMQEVCGAVPGWLWRGRAGVVVGWGDDVVGEGRGGVSAWGLGSAFGGQGTTRRGSGDGRSDGEAAGASGGARCSGADAGASGGAGAAA